MINKTTSSGLDPLSIRIVGSGEYVKKEIESLDDYFNQVEFEREELIKADEKYE